MTPVPTALPRRLHLELTTRCNSRCATCVRTFAPEPDRDLSFDEIVQIVDGLPELESVALQVNGEPLLHAELSRVLGHLADRGLDVELNTNGLLLRDERLEWLLGRPPARLHVSMDGATGETFAKLRGVDAFEKVTRNLAAFLAARGGGRRPQVHLWMTAGRESLPELPALVELAAELGADGVYLQRLVYFGAGLARAVDSLHGHLEPAHRGALREAADRAKALGVPLSTCGGHRPEGMLEAVADPEPWRGCRRPFESAVVMADGEVVPCCIATFVAPRRELAMGNVLSLGWEAVWHGLPYARLRASLASGPGPDHCRGCGVRWSL